MMRLPAVFLLTAILMPARTLQDVEYGRASGQPLRLDASIPDGPGPHPTAIVVHGGAWVTGDKQRSVRPLFKPLSDAGIAWFSINYRLARAGDLATLVSMDGLAALTGGAEDVRTAIAFVRAHASEWSIDADRLVVIGESAGAHLASMAALRPGTAPPVQAVVAFYSPSDLEKLVDTSPRIPDLIRQAVKGSPLEAMLRAGLKQISPQSWVSQDAPPFLMIHGTADQLVPFEQSETMCGALQAVRAACELVSVPGGGHGMNFWESQASMLAYKARMVAWLKAHF